MSEKNIFHKIDAKKRFIIRCCEQGEDPENEIKNLKLLFLQLDYYSAVSYRNHLMNLYRQLPQNKKTPADHHYHYQDVAPKTKLAILKEMAKGWIPEIYTSKDNTVPESRLRFINDAYLMSDWPSGDLARGIRALIRDHIINNEYQFEKLLPEVVSDKLHKDIETAVFEGLIHGYGADTRETMGYLLGLGYLRKNEGQLNLIKMYAETQSRSVMTRWFKFREATGFDSLTDPQIEFLIKCVNKLK